MTGPKMKMLVTGGLLAGAAAVGAMALQTPLVAQSAKATTVYRANLMQLNNSGASGTAMLRLDADQRTLTVMIRATGLERGGVHLSHIHGLSSNNGQPVDSTCPTRAQDSDRDGFVELAEGLTTYGPILIDFMNVDPDGDGRVNFKTTINLTGAEGAVPLTDRHVVIHGKTVGAVGAGTPGEVDGTAGYKVVLPVLCGEIEQVGNRQTDFGSRRPRS
jgi:hypothetical protein